MIQFLRDGCNILFNETRHTFTLVQSPSKIICNDRIIINGIPLFLTTSLLFYIIISVSRKFL